ncbi:hypothetical protein F511_05856 [Dorcoceras hygrometricum]|uniref:Uncharacterized protein n=1 Tax=Dorcoceras hygrometricum TaxID=472368 RepID=A0A2Z7CWS5_9LAMI|nr:hypothetical protein F511_05856 [Dorcoceras hygrometricum]
MRDHHATRRARSALDDRAAVREAARMSRLARNEVRAAAGHGRPPCAASAHAKHSYYNASGFTDLRFSIS